MPARLAVLQLNLQSDVPVGVEQGAKYALTGPDGTRVVVNDPSDPDFIGWLTEPPSGLDSPEVRESAEDIVEGDGGVHGAFYMGRRPWSLTGIVDVLPRLPGEAAKTSAEIVNRRITRLQRATRALRADAVLAWSPKGGVPVQLVGRRQQPLRITDRYPKKFLVAMVSAERRILSGIVKTASAAGAAAITARNDGNTNASPVLTLLGAWVNAIVTNGATGEALRLTGNGGLTTVAGDTTVIDVAAKTVTVNGVNRYDRLAFPSSSWWELLPADNVLTPAGAGAGATWRVDWRDAWE